MKLVERFRALVQPRIDHARTQVPKDWKFACKEEFILEHGQEWIAAKRPATISKRNDGECFSNSASVLAERQDWVYVEGMAITAGLPDHVVHHAWLIDPQTRKVIDPTWNEPENATYFGVPFKDLYLLQVVTERKQYGVIDFWEDDWPLLRGSDPAVFLWRGDANTA